MEARLRELRRQMPSKRALTSQLGQFVQEKTVSVRYTPTEQNRIKRLTELIQRATNDLEGDSQDTSRITAVVDAIKSTSNRNVMREAIRYLRIRLMDASPRVVINALIVTEEVARQGGQFVHAEISTEGFMNEIEDVYKAHANKRGRDSMEITELVTELVQAWGEAFMPHKYEYPYVIATYQRMRQKGVHFNKKANRDKMPTIGSTSTSSRSSRTSRSSSTPPRPASKSASHQSSEFANLTPSEIFTTATSINEMFDDMLFEAEKASAPLGNKGVIADLASQSRELVQRLESVIQVAATEGQEDIESYLKLNDNLHASLTKYDQLRGKSQMKQGKKETASTSKKQEVEDEGDDDPFNDFVKSRYTTSSTSKKSEEEDPFGDFVTARTDNGHKTETATSNHGQKTASVSDDILDLFNTPAPQPTTATNQTASPFDDLWGSNGQTQASAPAANDSNPFDAFEFEQKASIAPKKEEDPFASLMPAPSASNASKPFNPFD